eukprot:TRINITY_DN1045_c0_g1_i10.p1 TRINITY_DN1045_c0_g1~~TRINITY_DN1045_c0_g1_i10.p1  ORF type:complete len:204 (+),score=37.87 TRINITY_DN1045_c0_g1_i10:55-666(+)
MERLLSCWLTKTPNHWVPDDQEPNCTVCSRDFTLWVRHHHCRQCGHNVCYRCWDSQKVCVGCQRQESLALQAEVDGLREENSQLRATVGELEAYIDELLQEQEAQIDDDDADDEEEGEDEEEDEDDKEREEEFARIESMPLPDWAEEENLNQALMKQGEWEDMFGFRRVPPVDIDEIFDRSGPEVDARRLEMKFQTLLGRRLL